MITITLPYPIILRRKRLNMRESLNGGSPVLYIKHAKKHCNINVCSDKEESNTVGGIKIYIYLRKMKGRGRRTMVAIA